MFPLLHCFILSAQERAWRDLSKPSLKEYIELVKPILSRFKYRNRNRSQQLEVLGWFTSVQLRFSISALWSCSITEVRTKERLMASSAKEFLNSLWPKSIRKPSKYAYQV